MGNDIEYE